MERTTDSYQKCVRILEEELIPAMGCTEPIAFAYAAALARDLLGAVPDRVCICASGNLIKNVKSVIVPNTGGLKGIPAAAAAGIIAGQPEKLLTVISEVSDEQKAQMRSYLEQTPVEVALAESGLVLDLTVTVFRGEESAQVRIANQHTHVVFRRKNDAILQDDLVQAEDAGTPTDCGGLTLKTICEFADCVDLSDVREILDRQIACNMAIAEEGLRGSYGAQIGKVIAGRPEESLRKRCVSMAAAGSDARMNGCEMPVVINSGSGNQGITASVPVIVYGGDRGTAGEAVPGAGALEPDRDLPEARDRPPVRVLRRRQRRLCLRLRDRLPGGGRLPLHRPHAGECAGDLLRHDLRRGEGVLRRENCHGGGSRFPGI